MTWLVYALIGQLFYNVVNFVDKYLVERQVRDVRALPFFSVSPPLYLVLCCLC